MRRAIPLPHARDDNLDWPIIEGDWRAAKLARLLNHFDLRLSRTPSAPELLDLSIVAESKAVELLARLEGNPKRKDGKDPFKGRTVVDLAGYVLRRMFVEIEATLAKKSLAEREAFAVELSKRLQALPDDVKEQIRSQAGLADLSDRALMQTGAIAAVGGALAGTVSLAGFAAYTTLTSALAGMAGLFGLHLPFVTFIYATSTLAFLSNPIFLGSALLLGGGLLMRRANRQIRDRLVPVMVATATIAGVEAGGVKSDAVELAERLQRHGSCPSGRQCASNTADRCNFPLPGEGASMSATVVDLQQLLRKPIDSSTPGQRLADVLGGTETAAFTALSFGDIVYDRVSIDPNALTAFDFRKPPTEEGIYNLATWSRHIESEPLLSHAGHINNLKGSVFEQVAATSLRQSGAHVIFPGEQQQPGVGLPGQRRARAGEVWGECVARDRTSASLSRHSARGREREPCSAFRWPRKHQPDRGRFGPYDHGDHRT